jgi:hypothetical protein
MASTEPSLLFLKPWESISNERAQYFEDELTRELAPDHALYGQERRAVGKTGASDDVLYRLHGGTFAQVHLTFVREAPERSGWPMHYPFETLADWMIAKMLPDHIEHFALWPDGW